MYRIGSVLFLALCNTNDNSSLQKDKDHYRLSSSVCIIQNTKFICIYMYIGIHGHHGSFNESIIYFLLKNKLHSS